jgi:nicotinamidase-related amidase
MAARDNNLRHARHAEAPRLAAAALIVIDLQRAFTDPTLRTYVRGVSRAMPHTVRLVAAFRAAGRPVVFTRHAHLHRPCAGGMGSWWSSFVMEGTAEALLDPRLAPRFDEPVMRKESYSAFRGTRLRSWLVLHQVDTVVLCGTMTHICVDTTARDAFMRGYDVAVARQACASKHRRLHDGALESLAHACARVCDTDMLVGSMAAAGRA